MLGPSIKANWKWSNRRWQEQTTEASGGDGIPVELFHILKDDAVKVVHSLCQQWPQDWKRSVFIPILKKGNAEDVQTTIQLHSFNTLAK